MQIRPYLLVLLLLIQLSVFAQDEIVLKNNEIISCTLIEVMNDSVKYSTNSGNSIIIEKIAKDQITMIHFREKSPEIKNPVYPDTSGQANKQAMLPEFNEQDNGGPANALYSLMIPGLGDYKTRQKKAPYWIIGLVSYSMIGGGIYYKKVSEMRYKNYKSSLETDYSTYTKANDFHHRYLVMASLGAAIWLGDVLLVLNKGHKNAVNKQAKNLSYRLVHPEIYFDSYSKLGLKWDL